MKRHVLPLATITAALLLALSCQSTKQGATDNPALHALFDKEWEFRIQQSPLFATSVGRMEANDQLPSFSLAAEKEPDSARIARPVNHPWDSSALNIRSPAARKAASVCSPVLALVRM